MIYEIKQSSDFQTGAILIVRLPEEDLDKKAFYTILASQPDFLLPFRHKSIDGQVELTYLISKSSKLLYLKGNFVPKEYADILFHTINPLIECDDWFLTPYSFILDSNFIYYDSEAKIVKYLYVPSTKQVSDLSCLADMINALTEQIRVTDADLENKVLRELRKDFNPIAFIELLKPYRTESIQSSRTSYASNIPPQTQPVATAVAPKQQIASSPQQAVLPTPTVDDNSHAQLNSVQNVMPSRADDIVIEFSSDKKEKQKKVKEKPITVPKEKSGGFFGSKKSKLSKVEPAPIIMGGDSIARSPYIPNQQPQVPLSSNQEYQPLSVYHDDYDEKTMILNDSPNYTGFRLISNSKNLPVKILITIQQGSVFSIGRHAASVGIQQSDFEFGERTKEVSRRHAIIERTPSGYYLVDIGSKAGTFVNSTQIVPNVPQQLSVGDKVSFGKAGADYEWTCAD